MGIDGKPTGENDGATNGDPARIASVDALRTHALLGVMDKEDIITRVVHIIASYLPPQEYRVVLFGSWAKGNALSTSDIDIGILGTQPVPPHIMTRIRDDVDALPTLRSIDVVDLNAVGERFKQSALKHARVLSHA